MNTRSHTRLHAIEVASSSAPHQNLMGIEFKKRLLEEPVQEDRGMRSQKYQMGLPHYS
jgi:hypothetical protein